MPHPITQMIANQFRTWDRYYSFSMNKKIKKPYNEDRMLNAKNKSDRKNAKRLLTWTGAR